MAPDKPREECGVFGIFGHPDAAVLTALGLHALQHRGQEACGIVSFDGQRFYSERHLGLVHDSFTGEDLPRRLPGRAAIGHNRYSTQGRPAVRNIQPIFADLADGGVAIAHNGNITNARRLRQELVRSGAIFQSTMDTEVVLQLMARSPRTHSTDRLADALTQIEGGFSIVGLTRTKLIGARDAVGLRPLILGHLDGAHVLASETCALDIIGADFVREIANGEVIEITEQGLRLLKPFPERPAAPCVFEFVYFARPDSVVQGRSVYDVRFRMGQVLAREAPLPVDVIIPVPDSGVPAALGYADVSGMPFHLGIIRNHYIGRTFIEPTQKLRVSSISKKHSPNRARLDGQRVALIDDSIVRGNTSRKIVEMVREAGAAEVHFLSASPPIRHPDFYGIDMPSVDELMAARLDVPAMAAELKADSLHFLSIDGLYEAIGCGPRRADSPQFADHCFTGDYPTRLLDHSDAASDKERQLSLLFDL
jgi:amidophosphoribosyltransferase